jgi:hypothetical protein
MNVFKKLWTDEAGVVMSAETVMLGTMGVLAVTAGVGTMTTAVNGELNEMGMAFRSFDQSFSVPGFRSSIGGGSGGGGKSRGGQAGMSGFGGSDGGMGTVGSSYSQAPVRQSQAQLQMHFQSSVQADQAAAGRVIQRLDAAQLQQLQQFSDLRRDNVCSGSEL